MGDFIYLTFFVNPNHTFNKDTVMMWFEDDSGKVVEIGDVYTYFKDLKKNKKEIKETLKSLYPEKKGLYKEIKQLIEVMTTYEEVF